jgi:hypothetical protein
MSQSELNIRPGSFLGPEPRPFHLKYLGRLMVSPIGGCSFLRVVTQALTATLDRDSVTGSLDRNSSNGIVLISLVLSVSTIFCEIAANQPGWSSYHGAQWISVTEAAVYAQAHVVWRTRAIYSPTLGRELQELR